MAGGITNKQAKYLAFLCRQAGEDYMGNGLTVFQAAAEIDRLRVKLGLPSRPPERRGSSAARTA